ncbi:hypothetical protein FMN63_01075 [Stappia sp. BW2]|uniref:hypothetical protein n=1 Tax=Stappia sp. BW2 TaxID=2592622 RepID=UPI0011DE61B4|nr:hypothetical protein [Stappia sp. BW2]TYC79874.1 hypothetical protein FMN63_01075 [Stappia sp. BW2]
MTPRVKNYDIESLHSRLIEVLSDLPNRLKHGSVGEQVGELVQVHHILRDLGASIGASLAPDDSDSGRARMIAYLRVQTGRIVHTDELMVVSGIGDYPRRIREARADHGWPIISGMAVRDLRTLSASRDVLKRVPGGMATDEYILLEDRRDALAPTRWSATKIMRTSKEPVRNLVREYFERFPNQRITAEELRYLVGNKSTWTLGVAEMAASGCMIRGADLTAADVPPGIFLLET